MFLGLCEIYSWNFGGGAVGEVFGDWVRLIYDIYFSLCFDRMPVDTAFLYLLYSHLILIVILVLSTI